MMLDTHRLACALDGEITGRVSVLAPGPGHSRADRSLSIKIDPGAAHGFVVHSFAGDSAAVCRAHVLAALGIPASPNAHHQLRRSRRKSEVLVGHSSDNSKFALRLWDEAGDPFGTVVEHYLSSRGLTIPYDVAGGVVRYHPALKHNGHTVAAMVALFRDIESNAPCGIHRTFLDSEGRKINRGMLGRAQRAAIKIDADENVSMGLTIGEGFESCLAGHLAGFRPVWAGGSAGSIATFPVLSGVEALTILGEVGDGGANERAVRTCADRWIKAGNEVFVVTPLLGDDLNGAYRGVGG